MRHATVSAAPYRFRLHLNWHKGYILVWKHCVILYICWQFPTCLFSRDEQQRNIDVLPLPTSSWTSRSFLLNNWNNDQGATWGVPAAEEANLIQQHHLQPLGHKKKAFIVFRSPLAAVSSRRKPWKSMMQCLKPSPSAKPAFIYGGLHIQK